jgi:DNA-binding NarL/FixJ family response regulator
MTPERIRLALVDDHPIVRDGTAVLLDTQPDLEGLAPVLSCCRPW